MEIADDVAMTSLGVGAALFGSALVYIGATSVLKNPTTAVTMLGIGAIAANVGGQVAMGAVARLRGIK